VGQPDSLALLVVSATLEPQVNQAVVEFPVHPVQRDSPERPDLPELQAGLVVLGLPDQPVPRVHRELPVLLVDLVILVYQAHLEVLAPLD